MRRPGILAAIPLALTLALAGCGGGDSGANVASVNTAKPSAAASAAASGDPQAKALKFAQCMREHGIQMDDPEPGKGVMFKMDKNGSQEKMQQAQEACKEFQPTGMGPGGKPDPKQAEQMRKYSQCMRDNGVEAFPDPDGGMLRMTGDAGEDPDFKAANEKCAKEFLPGAAQGGS